MDRCARRGYVVLAWLFVGCLFVQLFLVGLDVFDAGSGASAHAEFAYTYGWLLPGMLLLGRVGRLSRAMLAMTALLLVLYAAQTLLPSLAEVAPRLAALHAVNALAIFWLALTLARRAGAAPFWNG